MRNLRSLAFVVVATSAATLGAAACGGDDSQGTSATDSGVADTTAADVAADTSSASDTGPADASSDVATDGGADGSACPATVTDGKIAEFLDPASAKAATIGEALRLTGVVATTPKFLVQKSAVTSRCLYGVFVADANATFAPYSGVLVTADGDPLTKTDSGSSFCTGGGVIPDDLKAGDVVNVTSAMTRFGVNAQTCAAIVPPIPAPLPDKIAELGPTCAFTKTGTAAVPAPADVLPADLATGAANLPKWAGGLVRVSTVTASTATMPGDSSFGVFKLTQSSVSVGDTIYYRGNPTAPAVAAGRAFTSITGVMFLENCVWTLEPASICGMQPPPFQTDASTCP